jgi:hypothetical protein
MIPAHVTPEQPAAEPVLNGCGEQSKKWPWNVEIPAIDQ